MSHSQTVAQSASKRAVFYCHRLFLELRPGFSVDDEELKNVTLGGSIDKSVQMYDRWREH